MSKSTLKKTIIKRTIGSVVLVSLFAILIFMGQSYLKSTYAKNMIIDNLKKSSELQIQQILPTLLLEEQFLGLKLVLDKISTDENLTSINFVKPNDLKTIKLVKCNKPKLESCDEFVDGNIIIIKPIKSGSELFGYLVKQKFFSPFVYHHQSINSIEILLLFLFIMFIIQLISLSRLTSKTVPSTLNELVVWVKSSLENKNSESKPNLSFKEFEDLASVIYKLIKEREVIESKAHMAQIAAQVSHDIRSPLAALSTITGQLQNIPEQQRLIIRSSVQRITDIANQLLQKGKDLNKDAAGSGITSIIEHNSQLSVQLLAPLIDMIISEKRIQLREKQGIEIEAEINNGYGLFAKINAAEFKRVLSNLMNNAIEALPNSTGKFVISIQAEGNAVLVSAQDNGKGIPEHILKKLGEIGVTFGKEGTESGSGIGVYHAKKTIESFGGKFEIISQEGKGTTILMKFPKSTAPKWFVEKLILQNGMQVISLDDDLSIHQVWKGRFLSSNFSSNGSEHLTFTSGQELKDWIATIHDTKSKRLYLMDYELLNQNITGLQIIEDLGIGSQSILVTSRYEETAIREKCERLGVRLIPKAMAGFVPIEIESPKELLDCLLIDDDNLMEMTWKMSAENNKKKFQHFFTADDFFNSSRRFDLETPIYVDSNLGHGDKGEEISKKIFEMGFKNIWLCTGYQASDFPPMPWIRGIVAKDPIFG